MELTMTAPAGQAGKALTVSDKVFACAFNETLVHQVVTSYLAGARAGTKAQKTRSEVRGGGRKPWRQKGTGRARAGTIRSPIWRSGGVTFAAKPRDYTQKVNKKMYRKALQSILSELLRAERLLVVPNFELAETKTKAALNMLSGIGITDEKVLLVDAELNEQLYLATRNLMHVAILDTEGLDPVSLVAFDKVVLSEAALQQIEERLA